MEGLIIWALGEANSKHETIDSYEKSSASKAWNAFEGQKRETESWRNAYNREKRLSDHRARRIESIYRGQILNKNKNNK